MSELVPIGPALAGMSVPQVLTLEDMIRELGMPEPEYVLEHQFAAGLYMRRLTVRAGALVTGKLHRKESILILLSGAATIWSSDRVYHIAAPHQIVSPAMTKRVLFSHTAVELVNVYPTTATTVEEVEREVIAPDQEALR